MKIKYLAAIEKFKKNKEMIIIAFIKINTSENKKSF